MEIIHFNNEFPKEDLQSIFRQLVKHSQENSHRLLAHFISEATRAVKDEIQQLSLQSRKCFSPFQDLFAWAEDTQLREGLFCGAVDGVLLVFLQICLYIIHVENQSKETLSARGSHLTALGVGLLSATAVSAAESAENLPLLGADAVRIAFRLGCHVQLISHHLEARNASDQPETWAYVVPNLDYKQAQAELDAFDTTLSTSKIFISAVNRTSITVSGPPSRLKSLFQKSRLFRDATSIALPVYGGLCHASHIYGPWDVNQIVEHRVEKLYATQMPNLAPQRPLHSTSSGLPYQANTALDLLKDIVSELLTKAIWWDSVLANVVDIVATSKTVDNITIRCFGKSLPLRDLDNALREHPTNIPVHIEDYTASSLRSSSDDVNPRDTAQAKLAIVGMSCRLPGGATDTEAFWHLLESGLDVSQRIPADRFDIGTHFDADGKEMNKAMTQYGCFIDEPGVFDAPFFNMSPREAMAVDPQMRLSLVTAYEALERAGFVGNRTPSTKLQRIGTYYGQAADDYREVNQGQEVGTYYIPGGCRAFGPGRINYFFKFSGPSYSIDTACSSGLSSIEVACQALWSGAIDMAVAGGVNVLTNPDGFTGLGKGHFLTKGHNACKTWDATADGYCRADGVGSIVIKRLEDAQADNDNVLGVILGAGTNHSAEAVSITHPHAGHQSYLSRQVLRQAAVNPLDVSYVEMHGTGTQAGDFEEMSSVLDVYAPNQSPRRRSDQALHIGSVKANVGHGESVAGTTSLIKVLLMLQKNAIPPHVGIKTEINPRLPTDLDERNVRIPTDLVPWHATPGKRRLVAINNFGAAGGNTAMILEEQPPRTQNAAQDPRQGHVVAVSAKTKNALASNVQRLITYLDNNADNTSLADLSYTTTARRYHHSYRVAFSASDIAQVKKQLVNRLDDIGACAPVSKSAHPSIAFTFTGQGASHHSMNLELYREVSTFREHIRYLDSIAQRQGFPSFIPALDGSYPNDHQHSPVVTQLSLVCIEIALAHYWSSLGVTPEVVIGHSLGEYAAMQVAGVISANDAIFMVGHRAKMLMQSCEAGSHCMVAVRASLDAIAELTAGLTYTVACVNGPSDTVVSGKKAQMDNVTAKLEAADIRCIKLDVAYAFHSDQMDPVLDDFEAVCKAGVLFHDPKMPVISPLLGKVVFDGRTFNANYVRRATRETVDFAAALQSACDMAISDDTVWIEIGPHPVCTNFIRTTIPSTRLAVPSMRRAESNLKTLAETAAALHVAGVELSWDEFHRPFVHKYGLRLLDLPTYAFEEKNYWMQYNGDWCLTKGNTYYRDDYDTINGRSKVATAAENVSSLVQNVVGLDISGATGTMVVQSDLMQKEFLAAAHGHRMNDCGVVTSSIHADIAYTMGQYMYSKFYPNASKPSMDITNLVVTKALIAKKTSPEIPQLIQVTAQVDDIRSAVMDLTWQNVNPDGSMSESFATANLVFGHSEAWRSGWDMTAYLVQSRIEQLEALAISGRANRLSRNLAYTLFAKNLVDYADKYRGMQSVVMHDLEAFADVRLDDKDYGGKWTVPPWWIDSVAHLAGFIMNCSDAIDTDNNYCVTSGWKSMRFVEPLIAGGHYRSYVRMIPTKDDTSVFLGDIYIMRADTGSIIGMVGGIHFRRFPRILLSRFFSAPEPAGQASPAHTSNGRKAHEVREPVRRLPSPETPQLSSGSSDDDSSFVEIPLPKAQLPVQLAGSQEKASLTKAPPTTTSSIGDKALALIAQETGIDRAELEDGADFAGLGIDSLMSLVLSEKFRVDLEVNVNGSLFLDYPTIGDLRTWLNEYYG